MTRAPYLEVTYRHGRALAAYVYLPRQKGDKSQRTSQPAPGLVVDFTRGGRAIGIEITAPRRVTLATINKVLRELGVPPLTKADLAPFRAA